MKTTNIFLTLFLLSAIALTSRGQSHFVKAKEDSLLSLLEQKNKAMGSLAVMDKGKIIYARAIGHAGITPEKKVSDEKTRYRIGSISKMFTATLVFQLIEENKIQLSATLDKFFPSVRNAEKITIGNLLNHRSGIHNFTNDAAYMSYMTKTKTKSEMIGIISANAPDFEPGDKFEYSNSNYVLLGYIVEDLRKEPYENVLQKYICSVAGLSDTHYGGNTDLSKNESYSFRYLGGWLKQPETDMSIPHGAGAIVSTPSDLVKFITALFDGKLIKPESLSSMKTISDGMGMGMQQFPYANKTMYGHGGGIDGFNSILIYIPEDKLSISYCSNGTVYAVNEILLRTLNNYYGNQEKLNTIHPPYSTVLDQELAAPLAYLKSVCGKDGINKVVILKGNQVLFKGDGSETVQNVWSCTKSFTSTVLGLLIEEGKCTLDTRVMDFLPELKENYPDLTFRHLATMTSGYKAKGDDPALGHGQTSTPFLPDPEPLSEPGKEFRYWDSAMNMFAAALTKVAGESIEGLFKRKIADPIGMDPEKWDWKDFGEIEGMTVSGGAGNKNKGIFISASEMARFGRLFLKKGNWNGRQVIPERWVEEATSPQVRNLIPDNDTPYGFNWWTAGRFPDAPDGTFAALGFNNNNCIVIPEWDMVIVRLGLDGAIDDEKWNNFIKMVGEAQREKGR